MLLVLPAAVVQAILQLFAIGFFQSKTHQRPQKRDGTHNNPGLDGKFLHINEKRGQNPSNHLPEAGKAWAQVPDDGGIELWGVDPGHGEGGGDPELGNKDHDIYQAENLPAMIRVFTCLTE